MPEGPSRKPPKDPRRAAERILAGRDHGRQELKRKLLARGFQAAAVERVLNDLQRAGFLDDGKYAASLTRQALERGRGLSYARAQLASRGIRVKALPATVEDEVESLRAWLARRQVDPSALTGKAERAKMLRFLAGRGYSSAAIARVFGWTVLDEEG
jgi:regulatory protein